MLKVLQSLRTAQKGKAPKFMPSVLFPCHTPTAFRSISPSAAMSSAAPPDLADSILQQKRALRSKIRKDLRSLPLPQRRNEETVIQNIVLDSSWFKTARSLCAYIGCEALREVNTSKILSEFLVSLPDGQPNCRRKLYVPRMEDRVSNMRMLRVLNMEDLVVNYMNILEPSPIDQHGNQREDVLLTDDPVDVIILPGVAFDRLGHRLGRGGGYYDVFLKKYLDITEKKEWRKPLLVALAYSLQVVDEGIVPITSHDVLIDAFVSPSGVTRISSQALERM